ncbi:MAG: hypothetical protein K2Z81_22870 [Cyanobacteria bacterium]|nr:hypothetical protein [Cyanobacteriota bacterium]
MKKKAGAVLATIAGALTAAALATSQVSHAYSITLGSPSTEQMRGVEASLGSTAQQMGLSYPSDRLISQMFPRRLQSTGATTTNLNLKNRGQPPVQVFITVPNASQIGGPTQISQIRINDGQIPIAPINTQQGSFTLNSNVQIELKSTTGATLDGLSVSFGALQQCPCVSPKCSGGTNVNLPNGVNTFSATLNPPNTSAQRRDETIFISCVSGANSLIYVDIRPGQGNNWSDLNGHNDVESIGNSPIDVPGRIDQNCLPRIIGVLKYNTPVCASSQSGPCGDGQPFCRVEGSPNNCKVVRSSKETNSSYFGGQVKVEYVGPSAPPEI